MSEKQSKKTRLNSKKNPAVVDPEVDGAIGDFQKAMQARMIMDRFYQYIAACVGYKDFTITETITGRKLRIDNFGLMDMQEPANAIVALLIGTLPMVLRDPTPETRKEIMWMLDEAIFASQVIKLAQVTGKDEIRKIAIIVYTSAVMRVSYMTTEEADIFIGKVKQEVSELTDEMLDVFSANLFGMDAVDKRFEAPRINLRKEVTAKFKLLFENPATEVKEESNNAEPDK